MPSVETPISPAQYNPPKRMLVIEAVASISAPDLSDNKIVPATPSAVFVGA
jgi:hypothetical protein